MKFDNYIYIYISSNLIFENEINIQNISLYKYFTINVKLF